MKQMEQYRKFIEEKLSERYPTFVLHGRTCFKAPDGTTLRIEHPGMVPGSTGGGIRL